MPTSSWLLKQEVNHWSEQEIISVRLVWTTWLVPHKIDSFKFLEFILGHFCGMRSCVDLQQKTSFSFKQCQVFLFVVVFLFFSTQWQTSTSAVRITGFHRWFDSVERSQSELPSRRRILPCVRNANIGKTSKSYFSYLLDERIWLFLHLLSRSMTSIIKRIRIG